MQLASIRIRYVLIKHLKTRDIRYLIQICEQYKQGLTTILDIYKFEDIEKLYFDERADSKNLKHQTVCQCRDYLKKL